MNNAVVWFAVGGALGFVLASFLISPSSSDRLVAQGAREKVVDRYGEGAAAIGDALNLWQYTPGLAGLVE